MFKTARENPHLFWAFAIIAFAVVMTLVGPKNKAVYEAPYDQGGEGSARQSAATYDNFYNFENDSIGAGLEAANRRQGETLYGRRYIYKVLTQCTEQPEFVCEQGEVYFADPYGCGCQRGTAGDQEALVVSDEAPPGTAYPVIYGEVARLRMDDSIELNAGDTLWIREFSQDASGGPQVVFDVYIAGEDTTYQHPVDADKLLYELELVASDYLSYAEVIIRQKNLIEESASVTSTTETP